MIPERKEVGKLTVFRYPAAEIDRAFHDRSDHLLFCINAQYGKIFRNADRMNAFHISHLRQQLSRCSGIRQMGYMIFS